MRDIEAMFKQVDFSRDTDLKERLRNRLFREKKSDKVVAFKRVSDEDLMYVAAAKGLQDTPPKKKDDETTL